ncbi:MAG: nucleotidyl transferase AbiEii/AbiGii toxin family protein [Deltaproteobacteria bacterium]|nr:nucleotidyl transferase AbiEii/AbiGii toxin family protein [Deltaproteobacteria bacterium]MBW2014370.1 nucleotidyl transferase AbiEii/AbiGii toxin family protein [Deltaproteobacteria bacterium]MBW2088961.1 nucleotidyl transferase AbiEii/AbiGii toxin family protein [Deltaproteobacteria bacterium]
MKNILVDLSGKISETSVSILIEIEEVSISLDIPFFIVGATARDIILEHQFDINTRRATLDIDIGVFISGWDQFNTLKNELIRTTKFVPSQQKQRLVYDDHFPVDIIPFGMIANENGSITWPPNHETRMSTAGFQECFRHALSVKLSSDPELIVKMVSLAGLALLKLISWDDNPERRSKDAPDLFLIMQHYLDAGNLDRLFDKGSDIIKEDSYDYDLASARFLGRDIANISIPSTKAKLIEILERKANSNQGHKIALNVLQSDFYRSESYERVLEYFNALLEGIAE